jgi:hypothetical protein
VNCLIESKNLPWFSCFNIKVLAVLTSTKYLLKLSHPAQRSCLALWLLKWYFLQPSKL